MVNKISSENLEKEAKDFFDYYMKDYRDIRRVEVNSKGVNVYEIDLDSGQRKLIKSKEKNDNTLKREYGDYIKNYSNFLTIGLDKISDIFNTDRIIFTGILTAPILGLAIPAPAPIGLTVFSLWVSNLVVMTGLHFGSRKLSDSIVDRNINAVVTDMTEKHKSELISDCRNLEVIDSIKDTNVMHSPSENIKKEIKTIPCAESIKDKVISLRTNIKDTNIKPLPTI